MADWIYYYVHKLTIYIFTYRDMVALFYSRLLKSIKITSTLKKFCVPKFFLALVVRINYGFVILVLRVRTSHSQTMNSQTCHFWATGIPRPAPSAKFSAHKALAWGFQVNPIAQKLLVITSNSQNMHSLTMHTRKTSPLWILGYGHHSDMADERIASKFIVLAYLV